MILGSAVPIDAAPRTQGRQPPAPPALSARAVRALLLPGLLLPGLLLLLWALAASCRWLPPQILPAPLDVAMALRDLLGSAETASHAASSARRVAGGFGIGALLGLGLAALMARVPPARDSLFPPLEALARVPVLGWLPLLLLLPAGIGETPVRLLVGGVTLVPVALHTLRGLDGVPARYLELGRVLGYTRWQQLSRIVVPAALATVWRGLRVGLAQAWLALAGIELLAADKGLGSLIADGRAAGRPDRMLAAAVLVGASGWALDRLLAAIEARLAKRRGTGPPLEERTE